MTEKSCTQDHCPHYPEAKRPFDKMKKFNLPIKLGMENPSCFVCKTIAEKLA